MSDWLNSVLSSFALVAVSEMGDKTQLLAFSLAARFKKVWPIMGGIFVATVLNHALASAAGSWISAQFSPKTIAIALGISFLAFGIWTLKPDTLDEKDKHPQMGAFLTTTILFFFAEMGDKTQLATVALGAKYQAAVAVTVGTTAGMLVTDGLAVFLGEKLGEKIQFKYVRWTAAAIFFFFGIASLVSAIS